MNIVKFGSLYINFSQMTHARDLKPSAPEGSTPPGVLRIEFVSGSHVDVVDSYAEVKAWIDQNVSSTPSAIGS